MDEEENNERLADLEKRIERHNEEQDFKSSMSEEGMKIKFGDGFASDMLDIVQRSDKDQEEVNEKHWIFIHDLFSRSIHEDHELLITSNSTLIDDYITRSGDFSFAAYHELDKRADGPDDPVYKALASRGVVMGYVDIELITEIDGEIQIYEMMTITSSSWVKYEHDIEMSMTYFGIMRDLIRDDSLKKLFFGPEEGSELDWSWKKEVWQPLEQLLQSLREGKDHYFHRDLEEQSKEVFEMAKSILYGHREIYLAHEMGLEEFSRDDNLIQEKISEFEQLSSQGPDLTNTVDSHHPYGLGIADIKTALHDYCEYNFGRTDYMARYATMDERAGARDPLMEKIQARIPKEDIKDKGEDDWWTRKITIRQKMDIPSYEGMTL